MPVEHVMSRIGHIEAKLSSFGAMGTKTPSKDERFASNLDASVQQLGKATDAPAPSAAQILAALQAGPVEGSAFAGQPSPNLEAIQALLQGGSTGANMAGIGALAKGSNTQAILNAQATGAIPAMVEDLPLSTDFGQALVHLASKHLGAKYVWGGESVAEGGFDCSGLIQEAAGRAGVKLPRVARDQAKIGERIPSLDQAKPGDLLTFGDPAHHIGIYVGDHKMLDAPSRGKVVQIKDLGNRKITDIRRVRPAGTTLGDIALQAAVRKGTVPASALQPVATLSAASSGIPGAGGVVGASGVAGQRPDVALAPGAMHLAPETATSQKLRAALQASAQASGDPEYLAVTNVNDTVSNVPYAQLFNEAGAKYGFSPRFLAAIAKTESNFNPEATSHAGAVGIMQLMPVTAREVGVDPANRKDVATNIDGATQYIAKYFAKQPNVSMGLAAYNAGPGAVRRYGGVPPYKETQNYVVRVRNHMKGIAS